MSKTKEEFLNKTPVVAILALICCILWGSAFPGIKMGYQILKIDSSETGTQILFAGLRFTLAGILTILLGSVICREFLIPKKTSMGKIFKLSVFQTILQYLFFYIGLANTSGVKASIIEGSNVFVAFIIASLCFHMEKLKGRKLIGCLVGFAGVVLVNLNGSGMDLGFQFTGEGFILLSTIAYSISSVVMKSYSKHENPIILSGYQFVVGGIVMILCGVLAGGHLDMITLDGAIILLYLAMVSAVAYTIWGMLLKYNPVSKVAVYGFMTPVCGVVLSAIFLDESGQAFGIMAFAALILVCIGIYLVNTVKEAN